MNIPDDLNSPPSNDPAPMPTDMNLSGGGGGGKMLWIIIAVVIVGGIGFFMWNSKKTREERTAHAKFMESFQGFEKDDLGKFWLCVLGPNADGSTVPSPDQITTKVDIMFANDFKAYPIRVREECAKNAKDAADKVTSLDALPQYKDAVAAYAKTITGMSDALDDWAKAAPDQVAAKMIGKNADDYGQQYHSFAGGTPSAEIIAYDGFLHCADPDLIKHKDNLELATHLFEQSKTAGFCDHIQADCGKLLTDNKPTAASKDFKQVFAKIGTESRDVDAFGACLKKARKGKLKDNLAPVGLRWVAYREARNAVLKIGAEALKTE